MGFGVFVMIPIWGSICLGWVLAHYVCTLFKLSYQLCRLRLGPFYSFFQMKEEFWFGLDWYGLNFEHTYHLGPGTYLVLLKKTICNSLVLVLGTFQNVHIRSLGIGSFFFKNSTKPRPRLIFA